MAGGDSRCEGEDRPQLPSSLKLRGRTRARRTSSPAGVRGHETGLGSREARSSSVDKGAGCTQAADADNGHIISAASPGSSESMDIDEPIAAVHGPEAPAGAQEAAGPMALDRPAAAQELQSEQASSAQQDTAEPMAEESRPTLRQQPARQCKSKQIRRQRLARQQPITPQKRHLQEQPLEGRRKSKRRHRERRAPQTAITGQKRPSDAQADVSHSKGARRDAKTRTCNQRSQASVPVPEKGFTVGLRPRKPEQTQPGFYVRKAGKSLRSTKQGVSETRQDARTTNRAAPTAAAAEAAGNHRFGPVLKPEALISKDGAMRPHCAPVVPDGQRQARVLQFTEGRYNLRPRKARQPAPCAKGKAAATGCSTGAPQPAGQEAKATGPNCTRCGSGCECSHTSAQAASPAAVAGSSGHAAADSVTAALAAPDEAPQVPAASFHTATALDEGLQVPVASCHMVTEPSEAPDVSATVHHTDLVPSIDAAAAAGSPGSASQAVPSEASQAAAPAGDNGSRQATVDWPMPASAAPMEAVQAPATSEMSAGSVAPAAPAAASSPAKPMRASPTKQKPAPKIPAFLKPEWRTAGPDTARVFTKLRVSNIAQLLSRMADSGEASIKIPPPLRRVPSYLRFETRPADDPDIPQAARMWAEIKLHYLQKHNGIAPDPSHEDYPGFTKACRGCRGYSLTQLLSRSAKF